jgi:hypothetical protein
LAKAAQAAQAVQGTPVDAALQGAQPVAAAAPVTALAGAPAAQAAQVAQATPAAPGARLAQAAQATGDAGTSSIAAAAPPTGGLPAAAARAPVSAPVSAPARAVSGQAATGDLPVEQFSPAALAEAAPTSAAATAVANAARSQADGLLADAAKGANGANGAPTPVGQLSAMNTAPSANPAGTGTANATRSANAVKSAQPGLNTPDARTVRNADGGERPAYAPRTNSYGYAEGDTYTYQVMDTWKDEVINRYTTAIEEVLPDGQMLANGQKVMMDAQGRLLKRANADGSISKFEPSQDLWWSNPKRGESRDLRFIETIQRGNGRPREIEWKGSTSVGKVQKIETPAGEFEVLPIESSGWSYEVAFDGLRSTKWSRTVWYSTKLGHPVAIDIQDADRLGKLLLRQRVELLHAQASRAASP